MKNIRNFITYAVLVGGMLFASSCEETDFTLKDKAVAFSVTVGVVAENGGSIGIPVNAAATSGSAATMNFEFVTEGIDNPAIEGEDFTVRGGTSSITFASYWGNDTIWLDIIDNDVYDRNKQVIVNISSATNGFTIAAQNSYTLTIADDEHPLAPWLGTYNIAAASYGDPGNWDEAWNGVVTAPNPDDETQILITGIAGSEIPIVATIDRDALTITLAKLQNIGDVYGYGSIGIYGDADGAEVDLEGTVTADGGIAVDNWAHKITDGDYEGFVWDVFSTTWTKQ